MPYITEPELRDRLPLDGQGVSTEQVEEAIQAAVEYVSTVTGDESGDSALARQAAASYAHADLLDIVFPRDARERDSESTTLRRNAERALAGFARAHPESDDDHSKDEIPDGYSGVMYW